MDSSRIAFKSTLLFLFNAEFPTLLAKIGQTETNEKWYRFAHLTPRQLEVYQRLHNDRLVDEYGEDHDWLRWLVSEDAGRPAGRDVWADKKKVVLSAANSITDQSSDRDNQTDHEDDQQATGR